MEKLKVWVWFKGNIKGGSWVAGFTAQKSEEEGYTIEKSDFISCRVPEWRLKFEQPEGEFDPPNIPEDPIWKYF